MGIERVKSFTLNFSYMNDKTIDYERRKIIEEVPFIKQGYRIKKWYPLKKNGTKALFVEASEQELIARCKELENRAQSFKGGYAE